VLPDTAAVSYTSDPAAFTAAVAAALGDPDRGLTWRAGAVLTGYGAGRGFAPELEYDAPDPGLAPRTRAAVRGGLETTGLTAHGAMLPRQAPADAGYTGWTHVADSTVTGEVVPPVLTDRPADWAGLHTAITVIRRAGGVPTARTGEHVNISAPELLHDPRPLLRLSALWGRFGPELATMARAGYGRRPPPATATTRLSARGARLEYRLFDAALHPGRSQALILLAAALTGYATATATATEPPLAPRRPTAVPLPLPGDPGFGEATAGIRELIDLIATTVTDKHLLAALWAYGAYPPPPAPPQPAPHRAGQGGPLAVGGLTAAEHTALRRVLGALVAHGTPAPPRWQPTAGPRGPPTEGLPPQVIVVPAHVAEVARLLHAAGLGALPDKLVAFAGRTPTTTSGVTSDAGAGPTASGPSRPVIVVFEHVLTELAALDSAGRGVGADSVPQWWARVLAHEQTHLSSPGWAGDPAAHDRDADALTAPLDTLRRAPLTAPLTATLAPAAASLEHQWQPQLVTVARLVDALERSTLGSPARARALLSDIDAQLTLLPADTADAPPQARQLADRVERARRIVALASTALSVAARVLSFPPETTVWFADFDGTLAHDHRLDPAAYSPAKVAAVRPLPAMIEAWAGAAAPPARLVINTARDAEHLAHVLDQTGLGHRLHYVGGEGRHTMAAAATLDQLTPVPTAPAAASLPALSRLRHELARDAPRWRHLGLTIVVQPTTLVVAWSTSPEPAGDAGPAADAGPAGEHPNRSRHRDAALRKIVTRARRWGLRTVLDARSAVLFINPAAETSKADAVAATAAAPDVRAVVTIGDDVSDLAMARAARDALAHGQLTDAVTIAVRSPLTPAAVLDHADLVVEGATGLRDFFTFIAALRSALIHPPTLIHPTDVQPPHSTGAAAASPTVVRPPVLVVRSRWSPVSRGGARWWPRPRWWSRGPGRWTLSSSRACRVAHQQTSSGSSPAPGPTRGRE